MALQVEVTRPARRAALVDRTRTAARSRLHARPGMARPHRPVMGRPQAGARPRAPRLGWRGRARSHFETMARQGPAPLGPARQARDAAWPPVGWAQQASRVRSAEKVRLRQVPAESRTPGVPRVWASLRLNLLARQKPRETRPPLEQMQTARRAARWAVRLARSAPCAQPSLQLLGAVGSPQHRSCVQA